MRTVAFAALAALSLSLLPTAGRSQDARQTSRPAPTQPVSAGVGQTTMAPFVSRAGVTKPPGQSLDGRAGTTDVLERRNREIGSLVSRSICIGC